MRIIGHALIELGLLTSLECGWQHCKEETRAFIPYSSSSQGQKARQRRAPSVDHVISRSDGGSDMPDNIQIIHFSCNSAKGSIDSKKNVEVMKAHSDGMKRMWQDPDQRRKRIESLRENQNRPETVEKKSKAMKNAWERVTPEERSERAKRSWETRRNNQKDIK